MSAQVANSKLKTMAFLGFALSNHPNFHGSLFPLRLSKMVKMTYTHVTSLLSDLEKLNIISLIKNGRKKDIKVINQDFINALAVIHRALIK